jgi:hypothetical protein
MRGRRRMEKEAGGTRRGRTRKGRQGRRKR